MTEAFRLAQIRVWRAITSPDDADLTDLRAAAARAGRRLVELRSGDSGVELTLGWREEVPLTPDDTGGPGGAGEGTVVVFAACLSCCWPDPDAPIFPGEPTTFEKLRQTLAPLGIQNVTHAVNRLRRCGYLLAAQAIDVGLCPSRHCGAQPDGPVTEAGLRYCARTYRSH
ncbi:hypothetical protein GCM10027563_17620 [Parasphingorhabdus pacifica]